MSWDGSVLRVGTSAAAFVEITEVLRARLSAGGFGTAIRLIYESRQAELVEGLLPYVSPAKPHFVVKGRLHLERSGEAVSRIAEVATSFNANCEYPGGSWLFAVGRDLADLRFIDLRSLGKGEMPDLAELAQTAESRGIPIKAGQTTWSDGTRCRASFGALTRLHLKETVPETESLAVVIGAIVEWLSGARRTLGGVTTWPAEGRFWIRERLVEADADLPMFAGFELQVNDWTTNVELDLLPQLGDHIDQTAAASQGLLEIVILAGSGSPLGALHYSWQLGKSKPEMRSVDYRKDDPIGFAGAWEIVKDSLSL
jgi:hypothetical protein